MSRLFDDANPDFLENDTAILSGSPFTVCGWFNTDSLGSNQTVLSIADKDVNQQIFLLTLDVSEPEIDFEAAAGSGFKRASTTAGYIVNTWFHAAGIEASSTDRRAFIDGGSKGTNSVSTVPAGLDRTSIGRRAQSSGGREFSGKLGHVAIWNVALTDQEILTLANGFSPLRVRRDAFIGYYPINGQSPEIGVIDGAPNLTLNGTPAVDEEPPITQFIKAA